MFLTETSTRHSLLIKHKHFREKANPMLQSNSTRLIGETDISPVDVDAETDVPVRVEQDSDDEGLRLADVPLAEPRARRKRQRSAMASGDDGDSADEGGPASAIDLDSDANEPAPKRPRGAVESGGQDQEDEDDKKKLAMDVTYEGFAIYGRVLCLVVKKRDGQARPARSNARAGTGQARMENWISSTQIPVGEEP